MGQPTADGRFGDFGGRFLPESLIPACAELEAAFTEAWADPAFHEEYESVLRDYGGRPTPVTECRNLSARLGVRVLLKREDLAHTGSHKLNNVIGQALLAKRMGKTRLIAETGAGQHGVATATAAALLGLRVPHLHGRGRRRPPGPQRLPHGAAGRRGRARVVGQPDAEGRHQRDPPGVGGHGRAPPTTAWARSWARTPTRGWCGSSSASSAPRPGPSARTCWAARDPDVVVACVGGGSNAAGTFAGFVDTGARLVGVEPAGGAAIGRGIPGVVHGSKSYLLQDEHGQVLEAHSLSAGLDYPGVGPEHSHLAAIGRVDLRSRPATSEVLDAFSLLARTEGIIPALEPAHALAWVIRAAGTDDLPAGCTVMVTLSGRGDKDVAQVAEMFTTRERKRSATLCVATYSGRGELRPVAHDFEGDVAHPRALLAPCLLLLLAEAPGHGYELMERLKPLGFDWGGPGPIYRELRALENSGLVASAWSAPRAGPVPRGLRADRRGPRRRSTAAPATWWSSRACSTSSWDVIAPSDTLSWVTIESALRAKRDAGRKLLVPYITGGLGDDWVQVVEAVAGAGRRRRRDRPALLRPGHGRPGDPGGVPAGAGRRRHAGVDPRRPGRVDVDVPLVVMTYYNIVFRAGHRRFARSLAEQGVSGAIVPDLPLIELDEWSRAADDAGVETILLVAPNTPDATLAEICRPEPRLDLRRGRHGRHRRAVDAGVDAPAPWAAGSRPPPTSRSCSGSACSTPAQAAEAAADADGVIVGSALVRRLLEGAGPDGAAAFVAELRAGLDAGT